MLVIMAISIVFDVSEQIDDFIDGEAPLYDIVVRYYLNFVVYYSNLFAFLLIFIAVILFTSKMAQRSEIIAILASGVSFRRMLRPYFIGGLILALLSLFANHFLVPPANRSIHDFFVDYMWRDYRIDDKNIHIETSPGEIVFAESVNLEYLAAYQFSIENWEEGKLKKKIVSDRVIFNADDSTWALKNYFIRHFNDDGTERIERAYNKDTTLNVLPSDFGERLQIVATLDYFELEEYIAKETLKGSNKLPFLLLEKHRRTSTPFATFILIIIGVSLSSRKTRGGTGMHIALGLLSAVAYIFLMRITEVAATNAGVDPLLSVWIPNIAFGIYAFILYRKAPK